MKVVTPARHTDRMPTDDNTVRTELTETEKARHRAAHSASDDLRAALISGDEDERAAAMGQFLQTISQLDPAATRDKLHVPDDAGQYRDDLVAMMLRIPDRWGRWIRCGAGWYPLITQLDRQLAELDPVYELHQCKEKFGTLRYYAHTDQETVRNAFDALIRQAERRSALTCEVCGQSGALHAGAFSWLRTLCPECAAAEGFGLVGETIDQLTPEMRGVWRVATRGSEHIWDLNHGRYTRLPGPASGSGAMLGDGESHRIAQVVEWPRVGDRSHVVFEIDGTADQWRISSNISKIERIR